MWVGSSLTSVPIVHEHHPWFIDMVKTSVVTYLGPEMRMTSVHAAISERWHSMNEKEESLYSGGLLFAEGGPHEQHGVTLWIEAVEVK